MEKTLARAAGKGPTAPEAPVAPVAPVTPVEPVAPASPVAPVEPVSPVLPDAPAGPCEPAGPSKVPPQPYRDRAASNTAVSHQRLLIIQKLFIMPSLETYSFILALTSC